MMLSDDGIEKLATQSKPSSSEATTAKKRPSGTLHTAVALTKVPAKEGPTGCFYIDSGASYHLVPSKGDLHAYEEFE